MRKLLVAEYLQQRIETVVMEVRSGPSILLVEDDAGVRNSLTRLLEVEYRSASIQSVSSAEEALRSELWQSADILLTDLKLPQMDGLELAERFKRDGPTRSAILITAYSTPSVLQRVSKLDAFVEKPLDLPQLIGEIDSALEKSSSLRAELQGLSPREILELYLKREQSAILNTSPPSAATVILRKGFICHAESADAVGVSALRKFLRSSTGLLTAVNGDLPGKQTLSITLKELEKVMANDSNTTFYRRSDVFRGSPNEQHPTKEIPKHSASAAENPMQRALHLLHVGGEHFRSNRLPEARHAWSMALKLNPECKQAKHNLEVLDAIERRKRPAES